MALSSSPRKVVPLATGDSPKPSRHSHAFTKRVFYCGVVIEGSEHGRPLPEHIQELVLSLGEPQDSNPDSGILASSTHPLNTTDNPIQRKRALTDTSALQSIINELVSTEQSYVKRLKTLKTDYADPLRKFSRSKETAIIPPYEAKTLFGNIDNLVPVNEAFLADLNAMMSDQGPSSVGGVGDVCLRHFKELKGFEHYKQYYTKREEAQSIFEREVSRRSSGFAAFIDRIKYSSADSRNRVGLRELLMDPVQRIPRYTLLFRTMVKYMAEDDPQRAKIIEADEIASKIAQAETDEQTKRAAIMYCLSASVDGFPPGLFSHSRRFIDCIDVEDIISDPNPSANASFSATSLHCTLFLFDDKLMIVKRPGNGEKGGRALAGLSDLDKVTKGGRPTSKKKSGMICKGIMDVVDVVATDIGGADFHLYLESPPQDQSERWSGRPFRSFSVVRPPAPINLDPTQTEEDKHRFLENLWNAQARYRARSGQSVILCADDREVDSHAGRATIARTYYNVYTRTAFLQEPKKTKVVVHIDALGSADPIPFGMVAPPHVVIRVQPLAGDLSRYSVTSSDPNDETEEDIVQTGRVSSRIVQTIHQYGLFKFRTGNNSAPGTPSASTRSRAAIFSLDAISRNLFNTRPGSAMGDFFGGSISGHRRTKSTTSRSSTLTGSGTATTSTTDSSMKLSHRSRSTATSATTMSSGDDISFFASSSRSTSRKLFKRAKSPGGTTLFDSESKNSSRNASPVRPLSRASSSAALSREPSIERFGDSYSDFEQDTSGVLSRNGAMDASELDLTRRLALAHKNSQTQHSIKALPPLDTQLDEETIYEDDPPLPYRPASRASGTSRESHTTQSTTTVRPETPSMLTEPTSPLPSRSPSRHSSDRRPAGPRCPSPLPPQSPRLGPSFIDDPDELMDDPDIIDEDEILVSRMVMPATKVPPKSSIPRSKRQPLFPSGNLDSTPRAGGSHELARAIASPPSTPSVAPLSVKKKSSVTSPPPTWRASSRVSPLSKSKPVSARKVSPQVRPHHHHLSRAGSSGHAAKREGVEPLLRMAEATKEDVDQCYRAVKRIKMEVEELRSMPSGEDISRPSSPDKAFRSTLRSTPVMNKAALERMQEMRKVISQRQNEFTPTKAFPAIRPQSPLLTGSEINDGSVSRVASSIESLVEEASTKLERVSSSYLDLHSKLKQLAEPNMEVQQMTLELQNSRRQCELVKTLLAETTAEKEIMYEAFNEELDGMYNDANLPQNEAWKAMTSDLKYTKESRNALSKENSQLKRKLAEVEAQNEEYLALLRLHGLQPGR